MKKWLGVALTLTAIVPALAAPWLAPHDPLRTDFPQSLRPPGTAGHLLGTDQLGRDLLARVLHGARLALFIGVARWSSRRSSAGCSASSRDSSSAGRRRCWCASPTSS